MGGCQVVVVDDEPELRSVVALILHEEGYRVETAANGAEALHVLTYLQPACVLLDMRMPVLDGWGFARELAARRRHIPLVVMTAAQDAQRWAEEIKAASYLAKPFDVDDLLEVVARLCREARGRVD